MKAIGYVMSMCSTVADDKNLYQSLAERIEFDYVLFVLVAELLGKY